MRWLLLAMALLMQLAHAAPDGMRGRCGDFPRAALQAPAGYCIGLVGDAAASGLQFPRRILEVAPDRFWIIDMGGWQPNQGRLVEMTLRGGKPSFTTLLDKLDRPHGLVMGPDGKAYVGEAGRVWRTPTTGALRPENVAARLPSDGKHPLKELAFDAEHRLFVSIGSVTDDCRQADGEQPAPCPESYVFQPRGAVYVVPLVGPDFKPDAIGPYASGLLESVALAFVDGANVLLQAEAQAEASPDDTSANAAPDELNVLRYGQHYGWPYCIGDRQPARGYAGRHDCARSTAPARLLTARSAPLQMVVPTTGAWARQLLVAFHGAGRNGHRVVAFKLGPGGLPVGDARTLIASSTATATTMAPTGITVDHAGRLWVVEDRNRAVLVMLPDQP